MPDIEAIELVDRFLSDRDPSGRAAECLSEWETTHAIAQLLKSEIERFRIRRHLGLEQAQLDVNGPGLYDSERPFLSSDEVLTKRAIDNLVARGDLDPVKLYQWAAYQIRIEREEAGLLAAPTKPRSAR
jgi:hypothetical protein